MYEVCTAEKHWRRGPCTSTLLLSALCLVDKFKTSWISGAVVRNFLTRVLLSNFIDASIGGPSFTPPAPNSFSSPLSSKDQYRPRKPFVTQVQIFGCKSLYKGSVHCTVTLPLVPKPSSEQRSKSSCMLF